MVGVSCGQAFRKHVHAHIWETMNELISECWGLRLTSFQIKDANGETEATDLELIKWET